MKKYIFFLFLLSFLFQAEIFSQGNKSSSIYQPKKNRKTLGYLTTAKKGLKEKDYFKAVANASCALNSKPKKRQVKKINGVMEKGYTNFLQKTEEKIDELKKSSATIETDEHVIQRQKIMNHFKELIYIQDELAKVDAELLSKINIKVDKTDHSSNLELAEKSWEEGKLEILEIHYALGKEMLEKSKDRAEYKKAGRQIAKVFKYESNYKDASELYLRAKEKGKTKMSVHFFNRPSQSMVTKMKGAGLENKISKKLNQKTKTNAFLSIYPNDSGGMIVYDTKDGMEGYNKEANKSNVYRDKKEGVHYKITGLILECEVIHNQKSLDPTTKTKVIKKGSSKNSKDDPGVKVTAKLTVHSKTSYGKITVSYKIIDTKTGEAIKTKRISASEEWFYEWGTYTGDKRALSKSDLTFVNKKQQNPPSDKVLIKGASENLAERISKEINEVITSMDL